MLVITFSESVGGIVSRLYDYDSKPTVAVRLRIAREDPGANHAKVNCAGFLTPERSRVLASWNIRSTVKRIRVPLIRGTEFSRYEGNGRIR